jgi:endo-1,4-beta-xylanase
MRLFIALAILSTLLPALSSSGNGAVLPLGVSLIGPVDPGSLRAFSPGGDVANSQTIPVTGQPFQTALQVMTTRTPPNPWDIQVVVPTSAPVRKGDTIELSVSVRLIAPNDGSVRVGVGFEAASAPYTKSLDEVLPPSANWVRIDLPFRSVADYAPGAAHMHVLLGYSRGTVDLAGFSLVDYGPDVDPQSLPHYELTYAGEEPDAPWRKAAEARIEKYREGDLDVVVRNATGKPVPGATVHVAMIRHAFDFGTAVNHWHLDGTSPADDTFRAMLLKLFTKATLENELKWTDWDVPSENRLTAIRMVYWLDQHNIAVRGHNLVWPSWGMSPPQLKKDYEAHLASEGQDAARQWLAAAIDAHISDEVGTLKGKVVSWDVINEPVNNHDFMDILGAGAMADWFKTAHAADPNARLYLNDFNDFYGQTSPANIAAFQTNLRSLIAAGAPLGGIGLESHFGGALASPDQILQSLSEFSQFHVPIEITEYDFKTSDPKLQADYTRDFLTLCYSWPSVQSFVMWGFWDGSHWLGDAPLYNKDWSLKASGQAFEDLVYHKWWTDQTGTASATGAYRTRAFLGSYAVTVTSGAKTKTIDATVAQGFNKIVVTL